MKQILDKIDSKDCLQCKKTFYKKSKWAWHLWNQSKFCSRECFFSNIKGKPRNWYLSEEHKKRLSEIYKGKHFSLRTEFKKGHKTSKPFIKGHKPWNKGIKFIQMIGENNPRWKGGITKWQNKIRHLLEYKQWRQAIYGRDDYRCLDCGERGKKIQADHIYPFSLFPRLRFMLENGRTLCKECHKEKTKQDRILYKNYAGMV